MSSSPASSSRATRRACPTGQSALHVLPEDHDAARALIDLLLVHGADIDAMDDAGNRPARALEARGLDEVADLLEAERAVH